jgi:peptidyl-prolyl cis-trans isomerase SurA
MKKFACCFLLITGCILTKSNAQTVFTYGNDAVSKQEFLKAYQKNNGEKSSTEKSYRNYLELYIRFKLKVKAAFDLQLDTLTSQRTELQNFRNQVADSYINDNASMNKLVREAFETRHLPIP